MWYSLLHGWVSRTQDQVGWLKCKPLRHVNKGIIEALSLVLIESAPKHQLDCGLVLCDNFLCLLEHLDAGLRLGA